MIPKPNGVPGTAKNRALEPSYHFQVTSDITDISRITQRWAKVEDNRGEFRREIGQYGSSARGWRENRREIAILTNCVSLSLVIEGIKVKRLCVDFGDDRVVFGNESDAPLGMGLKV